MANNGFVTIREDFYKELIWQSGQYESLIRYYNEGHSDEDLRYSLKIAADAERKHNAK